MAISPKKAIPPKGAHQRPSKAPGKTVLPRNKFQHRNQDSQRRFSLLDSDSDSSLSEFESAPEESNDQRNHDTKQQTSRSFHAIQSDSDEEVEDDDENEQSDSSSTNEEIWKTHSKKVVNTSSEEEDSEDESSSDDDEDVDFVKLTAERKAKSLEAFRSNSPFRSPSPPKTTQPNRGDVDFSFDFNENNHQLKIVNDEEEEDVGEELNAALSPLRKEILPLSSNEPLGFMNIEESSESDGDIDKDELLRTLDQDSDGLDGGLETGEDELSLLQREADVIAQEYDDDGLQLSSTNVTPRNSIVEEMIKKHKAETEEVLQFVSDDEYDSDDDYDEDEYNDDFVIPYFDDSVFKDKLYTESLQKTQKDKDLDSDDDSYLWDYFFSSGDENDQDNDDQKDQISSDDEATDEDTTLPPPSSRKKIGSKAQELLSSSSITARPPALGTWSTDSKPFGIIDGLSTRSLLPAPSRQQSIASQTVSGSNSSKIPMTPKPNNIEEFTLDELLNMSELEDDEDDELLNHQDWAELTASDRKVPLSAFRNKGIINDQSNHLNATRRYSLSNSNSKKLSKKLTHQKFNEITMTPVRIIPKNSKNKRKASKLKIRRQSMAEAAVEGMRATRSGLFSEDTLSNVEEFLSGLGTEAELSVLFREIE